MFGYPDTLDAIDGAAPLAEHPLNEGLAAWWAGLPPLDGGGQWYDLVSGSTAYALAPAGGPAWTPTPYGFRAYALNGTSQYLFVSTTGLAGQTNNFSVLVWAYTSAPGGGLPPASGAGTTQWFLKSTVGAATMRAVVGFSGGNATATDPNTFAAGWYRWGLTCAGTTVTLYRNGTAVATATGSGTRNTANTIYAGYNNSSYWPGVIGDVKMYGRALSAGEMAADYDLSQRGYPGVLRRYRPLSIFLGSGGTVYPETYAASCTPAGALTRAAQKALAGSSAPAGALVRQADKLLTGSTAAAGALKRLAAKVLTASGTPAGAFSKQADKLLTGSVAAAGAFSKQADKLLTGSVAAAGAFSKLRVVVRAFAATLSVTGGLARAALKALAAVVTGSGALTTSGGTPASGGGRRWSATGRANSNAAATGDPGTGGA